MSTGPQAKVELSPTFRHHPATFDRYLRDLGNAGLIRRSGKGGGKAAVHLNDLEITRILLSMASPHPGGAAEAVKALGRLWPEGPPQAGMASFVTELAGTIASFARAMQRGEDISARIDPGWTLTMCLDPLVAWVTLPLPEGGERKQFFRETDAESSTPGQPAGIEQHTVVTKTALIAVAKLCAHNGQQSAILVEPSAPASAGTETRNAGSLPGEPAPSNQDRANDPRASNTLQDKGAEGTSQSPSERGPVTSPSSRRVKHHGPS